MGNRDQMQMRQRPDEGFCFHSISELGTIHKHLLGGPDAKKITLPKFFEVLSGLQKFQAPFLYENYGSTPCQIILTQFSLGNFSFFASGPLPNKCF